MAGLALDGKALDETKEQLEVRQLVEETKPRVRAVLHKQLAAAALVLVEVVEQGMLLASKEYNWAEARVGGIYLLM